MARKLDLIESTLLVGWPGGRACRLSISEIRSGLNSQPSQSWTAMVEAMNPELPPVDTWS